MKRTIFLMLLAIFVTMPAHAGHGTIRETDTQIFVEYWGDEDDYKAALQHKEELAKEEQEQNRQRAVDEKMKVNIEKQQQLAAQKVAKHGERTDD